jgi:hypothetical protein
MPRSRPVARPMSPRIAWTFILLLSNEPTPDISDRELARLKGKYRTLLDSPHSAVLLRSWLRNHAQLLTVAVSQSEAGDLRDPMLVPSGLRYVRSEIGRARGGGLNAT